MASRKTNVEKKAPARRAATARRRKPKITHEQIAERAYFISRERGGSDMENWLEAERELTAV